MRTGMRYLALFCLILLWAEAGGAAEMVVKRSGEVRVRYRPVDAGKAEKVVSAVDRMRQDIRNRLGVAFRRPVDVVLARGRADFERWAGSEVPHWALAVARTGEAGVVIDVSKTGPGMINDLVFTVRHELCHLALGQVEAEAGRRFPLWFHEGVAEWASGAGHFSDRTPFVLAAAHGNLIPLGELVDKFPDDPERARLAYLQSEDFVTWLSGHTAGAPERITTAFGRGLPFPRAVEEATGRPLEDWEVKWREVRRSPHPWWVSLREGLSLFTALAIATALAYVIVKVRRWRVKRSWEREERWMDSLPDEEFDASDDPPAGEGPTGGAAV